MASRGGRVTALLRRAVAGARRARDASDGRKLRCCAWGAAIIEGVCVLDTRSRMQMSKLTSCRGRRCRARRGGSCRPMASLQFEAGWLVLAKFRARLAPLCGNKLSLALLARCRCGSRRVCAPSCSLAPLSPTLAFKLTRQLTD